MNTQAEIDGHEKILQENREKWGKGEWQKEPNRVEFEHAGLQCLLSRNHMGAWCGYVGVPKGHPAFEVGYDDLRVKGDYPQVHGGLTYADHCQANICHVTKDEDNLWWLGFDCAHSGDVIPGMSQFSTGWNEDYKTVDYAREQTKRLAEQLSAMKADQ